MNEVIESFVEQCESEGKASPFQFRSAAMNPFSDFSCVCFKKCCKKYKEGKRCKKCPGRKK
ncbi:MAG: hypothetical protein K0R59_915 [Sphingobacterium sp.]|jgi:hypothetical protein|nr:hypothetical protein [Sphingobacterium sp.]OOG19531.1 hypothetical protein BWD42_06320 [Sphingobacterium sp. CZ-UAM]